MLHLIILNEQTTSDLKIHASSSNQLIIQNLQFALISMEGKIVGIFANKAVKEKFRYVGYYIVYGRGAPCRGFL